MEFLLGGGEPKECSRGIAQSFTRKNLGVFIKSDEDSMNNNNKEEEEEEEKKKKKKKKKCRLSGKSAHSSWKRGNAGQASMTNPSWARAAPHSLLMADANPSWISKSPRRPAAVIRSESEARLHQSIASVSTRRIEKRSRGG